MGEKVPGARWLRCDLHVHTPFDPEKKFGEDLRGAIEAWKNERPHRLAEIADRFVQACRDAADGEGLDLVALTDHNSIDGYRYLKDQFATLALQARDQGIPMPAILPGVEFSVGGERPIHFLVIFAASAEPDAIDGAIRHVFGPNDRFDPKRGTPRATGKSVEEFLRRLYEYCRPPSGDRTLEFVVLPAHADSRKGLAREVSGTAPASLGDVAVATTLWDEMKGHLRERVIDRRDWHGFQTVSRFEDLPQAFKELLCRWSAARRGEDWDELTKGQKARYREQRHWALVECSDPHSYEDVGSRYTWLKMEVPDIEGIRLALLDPESRLRRMADGPPGQRYPRIERIRVRNTDFFEQVDVPLSPCLTTLIGGRGSGKSTLIEYLRHALDRDHREDFGGDEGEETRSTVEKILKAKKERDFGETPGTLLPDSEFEVDLVVAERHYRLRRVSDGIEVVRDPGTPAEEIVPLDARSLISPRVLSQRQIAGIAKDPAAQRFELDALLDPERLAEIKDARRAARERLQALQSKRSRLKQRLASLPGRKTELQKVKDQIDFLKQAGGKDALARFQAVEQERHWLDGLLNELEQQAEELGDQAEAVRSAAADLPELPAPAGGGSWLEKVRQRVVRRLEETASVLKTESQALRDLSTELGQERAERWQPGYDEAQSEYEDLRREMEARGTDFTHHERLLQQRLHLRREIKAIETAREELERVGKEIKAVRSELAQIHERRLALRRQQAEKLKELDADVRLEVLPFQDRKDFESRREEWFSGAGLQERDWAAIVEYVFSPNGSVAESIETLVLAWRTDVELTAEQGKAIDASESCVMALLDSGEGKSLTKNFLNALERAERLRLDELERFLPEDAIGLQVRAADGRFTPIQTGSVGQRSTAILSLLLSAGDQPLVIDQPEDDLDNRYIYDIVVSLLRHGKFSRQIVIATHNANIPVNGDAELIVALGVEDRLGTVLARGSIDRPEVKEQVSAIMEGSAEAFRLRRERYGY